LFTPISNWHVPYLFIFVLPIRLHRSHGCLLLDPLVLSQRHDYRYHLLAVVHPCRRCRGCLLPDSARLSAARRSHDTTSTTAADVGGATLWPPASLSAQILQLWLASAPAAAAVGVGGGGATPPLPPTSVARLTTCVRWGAGWPRDGCPVAPPR
jgi:hypothetical protein